MKWTLTCLAASFLATTSMAQEVPPAPKSSAEHQILAADVGTWDATIKSYMGGSEPIVSKGTEVNEVLAGGLWVVSRFEGNFGPVKFEGRGQFGFDPVKKKYVGSWIDTMSPCLTILEGSYDPKTKTMSYVGDGYDPSSKSKYTQKMVTTVMGDGTRVFTLYMKMEGDQEEAKAMEITYTKRK